MVIHSLNLCKFAKIIVKHIFVSLKNMRKLGIVKRTQLIKRILSQLDCLKEYKSITYLTRGSIGDVFLVSSETQEFVAKIQILYDLKTEMQFNREVKMQTAFYPKSPFIVDFGMSKIGKYTFGTIIMEKLEFEMDHYLGQELTIDQLNNIIKEMYNLLQFAQSKKLIHGDTALFNLGLVKRNIVIDEISTPTSEWIFIDFDKSSECINFTNLDYLRLSMEFHPTIRSHGTKPIHDGNACYFREHFSIIGESQSLEKKWRNQFELYLKVLKK